MRVARVGEPGERRLGLDRAGHRDGVELAADLEALRRP